MFSTYTNNKAEQLMFDNICHGMPGNLMFPVNVYERPEYHVSHTLD